MTTVKCKKALPKGVLAQDEFAQEKEEKQIITQVSLHIDFKVRDIQCSLEDIAKSAIDAAIDSFDDCVWARAQVLEYKEV